MNSYTTLLGLSVLLFGNPSHPGDWDVNDVTRSFRAAWGIDQPLPHEVWADATMPSDSGDTVAPAPEAAEPADMSQRGGHSVLANSATAVYGPSQSPVATQRKHTQAAGMAPARLDVMDEEEDDDFTPPKGFEQVSMADAGRDENNDARHEATVDDSSSDDNDDEPLVINDIEPAAEIDMPTPPTDEAKKDASSETEADVAPVKPETVDADAAAVDDFKDFGGAFRFKAPPKPAVKVAPPVIEPAAVKQVPAPAEDETPAESSASQEEPRGLSSGLRQGISIARMTLKDQPSELIRVSVNTSMVVDLSGSVDAANIVDPNIADIIVPMPNRVIVVGKSAGTTQLVLTIGQEHRVFHVYVEPNLVVLTNLVQSLVPRSDVRIGSLNGQLVLQGNVPDATTAKQIEDLAKAYQGRDVINHLMISGTQQTLLRVVVAEVNKEALRNLGFNWAIGASDWSRDFFFANNVAQLNPTTFSSSGLPNVLEGQQLYSVAPVGNGPNTNISFGFPKAELQIFMNALRQNGLARMLAEPNLVAISGQTATFLAGGEVPIPVSQGGAVAGAITIEYKEFGVRLAFTPTVGADQIIRLHVMSEVSDAVPGSRQIDTIPVFTFRTRRVESTIECPNGKTFAIAGLLNESVNAIANKIPGLGDVPVLGQLFSSVDYQRSNTELVVLVTPQLVEALEPNQLVPVPGQDMEHPDDWEFYGLGMIEGRKSPKKHACKDDKECDHEGTLVHREKPRPMHANRLQGSWGIEDREPGALDD